jgi:hypothetical protein
VAAKPRLSSAKRDLLARLLREKGIDARAARQALQPRPADALAPLHPNQEGLWFIDQVEPGQANYSMPCTVRLAGKLDREALERSLEEIVRRHEALRTTFPLQGDGSGSPYQAIAPAAALKLASEDLADLPEQEREAVVLQRVEEEVRRPFDLERGPLFRAHLLRLHASDHVLSLNFHHAICDGWSMGVFTRELKQLYEAFSQARPSPLPDLPIQYADYALWQRERMASADFEEQRSFWREQMAGEVPNLSLPTDHARPSGRTFRGSHQAIEFSEDFTSELRGLAQREGVTAYVLLLTAFEILLHRFTAETDIVVGSTFADRGQSELEDLIGFFANTLPIRVDLSGNPSFRELLGRTRDVCLATQAHQEMPFPVLVKELQPQRDADENPFYRIVFDFLTPDQNPAVYGYGLASTVDETVSFSGLTMTPQDVECGVARFDVAIFIWDMARAFRGTVEYRSDLFERGTIQRMVDLWRAVLGDVVADPERRVDPLVAGIDREDQRLQKREKAQARDSARQALRKLRRRR